MDSKTKKTEKDLLNACALLVVLKDGGEFLRSEIKRKSGFNSKQTDHFLNFLRENLYVIPRAVPEGNKILVKYSISKRGMKFLVNVLIEFGSNQKINFTLCGKELNEALKFRRNHPCSFKKRSKDRRQKTGAIGGETSYSFTPTSLGVIVTVLCACGKEKNVTDYDSW